jgi:carboxyl-terminal processing protease
MNRLSSALFLGLLATTCVPGPAQAAEGDWPDAGRSVQAAAKLLVEGHISHRPLDDRLSRVWFDTFLLRLDPRRMYFLASDWREFEPFAERLDDLAKEGSFLFPILVRQRLRERVARAGLFAEAAVEADHDYTFDEGVPRKYMTFATTEDELRERWRRRVKLEMLIEKLHGRDAKDVRDQLTGRYRRIVRQARELSDERLCEAYVDTLAQVFDPHAGFVTPFDRASLEITIRIRRYTLGFGLRSIDGKLIVRGYLAPYRSHMQRYKGWEVLALRRVDGPTIDVVEMHPGDVGRMISDCVAPFGDEGWAIVEVLNPRTLERRTLEVQRLRT